MLKKTQPVGERPPPRYFTKSSTGACPRKVTKAGPPHTWRCCPYGSGLNACCYTCNMRIS